MQRQINSVTRQSSFDIRVAEGDICDRGVEAIVNAANSHLWMGGGVAGAIKRRGGPEIEREAIAQGPIPIGESAVTGAGTLELVEFVLFGRNAYQAFADVIGGE